MIKIIHNNQCSKSNCALDILKRENTELEIYNYLEQPLTTSELRSLIHKIGISAAELVRKTEPIYKEKFQDKSLTEEEWIQAMVKYPILIQRPILINGEKAIIGREIEHVLAFLKQDN